ncbi:TrbI/VirB10 family protein, partial [Campylobacter upsaliensis]
VYSANGNTLLIEKGSTITGTFNAGQMDDGMDRLFVIWQEIRTPNNIIIPVYSGATDELGASGMQGWVDHHYLKRFGSAILLSMIDDGMAILADQLSKNNKNGNNYYNYSENTRENVGEIANTALEKMIDIKPTLYKNHGDLVGVYVNRDIDFSKVYKLTRKKNVNHPR